MNLCARIRGGHDATSDFWANDVIKHRHALVNPGVAKYLA